MHHLSAEEESETKLASKDDFFPGTRTNAWVHQLTEFGGEEETEYAPDLDADLSAPDDLAFAEGSAMIHDVEVEWRDSYSQIVTSSWAYEWLLASIHSICSLQVFKTDAKLALADFVRSELYTAPALRHLSARKKPIPSTVRFSMDWKLRDFLINQAYECELSEAVSAALVVTGDETNAQACTSLQYMQQTWPASGEPLLRILQAALSASTKEYCGKILSRLRDSATPELC